MRTFKCLVSKYSQSPIKLGDALHSMTKMDILIIKEAAQKGAVWLQKNGRGKTLRQRSVDILLDPSDIVVFYYESHVLNLPELTIAESVFENKHYGIWIKEAGVVPQGTQAGDHTSLLRFVEKKKKHEVYLIHRLDRETRGLMIIGYTKDAASKLSELFLRNKIFKMYEAIVLGDQVQEQTISHSLDGKEAFTHIKVISSANGLTHLKIKIDTGRLHQIRRHLEFIGSPIMGDPKYGRGNKNKEGLMLVASDLSFQDPWSRKEVSWSILSGLTI